MTGLGAAIAIVVLFGALLFVRRFTPPRTDAQQQLDRWTVLYTRSLVMVMMAFVIGAVLLIEILHWDSAIAFATSGGITAIYCAATRSRFFWEDLQSRWLRSMIGDTGFTVVSIGLGLYLLGWSYRRHLAFDAFAQICSTLLAAAPNEHARLGVLSQADPTLKINTSDPRFMTCGRMIETGRLGYH